LALRFWQRGVDLALRFTVHLVDSALRFLPEPEPLPSQLFRESMPRVGLCCPMPSLPAKYLYQNSHVNKVRLLF
jgi:hypothetical protein